MLQLISQRRGSTCNHQIFRTKRCKQNSPLQEKSDGNGFDFTWDFFSGIY